MHSHEIQLDSAPQTCVVRLFGDIDTAVVPEIKEAIASSLANGCINVVLDMTGVVYADSSALGLLVWLDRQLGPLEGRLVLAGANPDVQRILELSGLVGVAATIVASEDVSTALAGLKMAEVPARLLWEKSLRMNATVDGLATMREEVCDIISELNFADSAVFDIKVALGEALANAVRHGSPKDAGAVVDVAIAAFDDRIVIEVCDTGIGFDGTEQTSDDIYAPGGRGIMFMRALMDRVEFENPESGGTCVRLVKHRAGVEG